MKRRLANAPKAVTDAAEALYATRHVAVHEGGTRVEQSDAVQAINAMDLIRDHLDSGSST